MNSPELESLLKKVVEFVNNAMVDPDIEIDYCIPDVATTSDSCDVSGDPYIEIKYPISETIEKKRKVHLTRSMLNNTPQEIANQITFIIEEFKSEIEAGQIN